MADVITLTCPTCGGKLQITPDLDRFACTHCGNEHIVKRSEGLVALQPLAASLSGLQRATDRAASELGLRRASEELARIESRYSTSKRALEAAQLALEQGRRRTQGYVLAGVLDAGTAVCCATGAILPIVLAYTQADPGEIQVTDAMATLISSATCLGVLLLVLAVVFTVRAFRLPAPTQSSTQARQSAAAAQGEVNAASAELEAKRAEVEELRRAASRSAG